MNVPTFIPQGTVVPLLSTVLGAPLVAGLLAMIVCRCFRRASAAARHWVWFLAFVVMATCFAFAVFHLGVSVPILSRSAATIVERIPPESTRRVTAVAGELAPSGIVIVVRIWLLGVLALLLRSVAGILRLRAIVRRGRALDGSLPDMLCAKTDWSKWIGVRHLISAEISVPMVAGIVRPVVLLPESALTWPRHLLQAVLAHEHAHVERRDLVMLACARFVTFLHWMNPVAWYALRRMQAEAEMAADDCVVLSAGEPVAYAEGLVGLIRVLRKSTASNLPAMGMLRGDGSIQARVARILDPKCRRLPLRASLRWGVTPVIVVLTSAVIGVRFVAVPPIPVRGEAIREKPYVPAAFESAPFTLDSPYPAPSNEDPVFRAKKLMWFANGYLLESVHEPGADGVRLDLPVGSVAYSYFAGVARAFTPPHKGFNFNGDFPGPGYREQKQIPVGRRLSPAKEGSSIL